MWKSMFKHQKIDKKDLPTPDAAYMLLITCKLSLQHSSIKATFGNVKEGLSVLFFSIQAYTISSS